MRRVLPVLLSVVAFACATERRSGDDDDDRATRRTRLSTDADRDSVYGPQLGKDGKLHDVDPIDALFGDGESASGRRYGVRAAASGAPSAVVAPSWSGLGLSGIGAGNGEPPFGGSRAGTTGPGVADQGLTVRGSIAPETVQGVLRSAWDALRLCYEATLAHRSIAGDLDVAFDVAPDGTVSAIRSEGTLRDATAKLCIHRVFEALRFPPVGAGGASIHSFLSFYPAAR